MEIFKRLILPRPQQSSTVLSINMIHSNMRVKIIAIITNLMGSYEAHWGLIKKNNKIGGRKSRG